MPVSPTLSWPELIGRRLARHHLLEPAPAGSLVEVASEICGAHAQVGASAELMLALRVRTITRRDVRVALWDDRTLVKTVGLRGTLHLFPAAEVPLWMAANQLRFPAEERRLGKAGIDLESFHRVVEVITEIVGKEPISRPELEQELEARAGGWAITKNQGWVGSYKNWPIAVGWAAALGKVCYGPGHSGRISFVRPADWCGWRQEDPIQAGLWVLRRFLRAYGPSTRAEFSRWFALEPAIAKRLFEELAGDLAEVEVDGSRRWMLKEDLDAPAEPARKAVSLLPHFDAFVVGSHPREQLMEPGSPVAVASPGTAAPLAVLLVGGRVSGVWTREPKGKRLRIRVDAHVPLTRRQGDSVAAQAQRIAQILEKECELEFGPVPLRFHL
jgi:hypothetical protein